MDVEPKEDAVPQTLHRRILGTLCVLGLAGAWGCSGSSNPVGDTGQVSGTVVEERVFTPVPGAKVEIGGTSTTAGTDGAFSLAAVPKGEQRLTVAATGYLPFSTTVQVVPGPNDVGQLWLKPSQQDGGAIDGGVDDAAGGDGGATDGPATDATPPDAAQLDAAQQDAAQLDVIQADHLQVDVIQTDHLQVDVIQTDHLQSDVLQHDASTSRACGTLALAASQITPGVPVVNATFTGASLTAPHAATPCVGGGAAPEHVYWYHHDHVADLVFEVTQSGWDVVAYIRQDCDALDGVGTPIADPICADGTASMETVVWPEAPIGDYYFFVDGQLATDLGAYQAKLTVREVHDVGQYCDGITARCKAGQTCQGNLCYLVTPWCDSHATGTLQAGVTSTGDTTSAANNLQCQTAGSDGDQYWNFTADGTGGLYNLRATSTDHDVYLYTTTNCTDPELSANCTGGSAREADLDLTLAAGQHLYVVVDGYNGQQGTYSLTVAKVQYRNLGEGCDPLQLRVIRCVAGTFCDETSHCAAKAAELEPNDTPDKANAATSGQPILGAKSTASDVDYFSISATAGDVIVAETTDGATSRCGGSSLDSRLRVFSAADLANPIAMNDDEFGTWCSFVIAPVTTTGVHYVALDYYNGGTGTFDYTLRIWVRSPAVVTETAAANDSVAAAQAVAVPMYLAGALDPNAAPADTFDYAAFAVPAGHRTFAKAFDATGTQCSTTDDRIALVAPDGVTTLMATIADCEPVRALGAPTTDTYFARIGAAATMAFPYRLLVFTLPW